MRWLVLKPTISFPWVISNWKWGNEPNIFADRSASVTFLEAPCWPQIEINLNSKCRISQFNSFLFEKLVWITAGWIKHWDFLLRDMRGQISLLLESVHQTKSRQNENKSRKPAVLLSPPPRRKKLPLSPFHNEICNMLSNWRGKSRWNELHSSI